MCGSAAELIIRAFCLNSLHEIVFLPSPLASLSLGEMVFYCECECLWPPYWRECSSVKNADFHPKYGDSEYQLKMSSRYRRGESIGPTFVLIRQRWRLGSRSSRSCIMRRRLSGLRRHMSAYGRLLRERVEQTEPGLISLWRSWPGTEGRQERKQGNGKERGNRKRK